MKDVAQLNTCLGYGDGIDVFWNDDKIKEAQDEVDEESANEEVEPDEVVVVIEVPTRRASLDLDGIAELRDALDKAEQAHRKRKKRA